MCKTNKKTNTELILFFAFCIFLVQAITSKSYAAYEIVKAKTITNENLPKEEIKNDYIPTYNDPDLPDFSEDSAVITKAERVFKKITGKFKRKKGDLPQETLGEDKLLNFEDSIEEEIVKKGAPIKKNDEETIDDRNKFQINADKLSYDDGDENVYAKGNVEIIAKAQKVALKADEAILDKKNQTIKMQGHVKVIKDGSEMLGEYMFIDLNEQNILMDNPTFQAYSFQIKAQEGYLIANDIQMLNGTMSATRDFDYEIESRGFLRIDRAGFNREARLKNYSNYVKQEGRKRTYKIDAKEIVVASYKDHNTLLLKGANVYYNKHKVLNNTTLEMISDKEMQIVETNALEMGAIRGFGTYAGYGFVSKLPKGHIFKVSPIVSYGDGGLGVGILGKYRSQNGILEAGYNTSSQNLVARGRYKFGKGFELRYGRHAYIPENFLGARRSGYAAELQYSKEYYDNEHQIRFFNGVYAGLFSDYKKHNQEKDVYATSRFRYMASLSKRFLTFENKEQDMAISFYGQAQAAATVYGSGQTMGIVRVGPQMSTKVKKWNSTIGYLLSGLHGDSPFYFDKYRYGRSSIYLNERFDITDKIAIGYTGNITPKKDNPENDLLTESRFYVIFGPQDLKFSVSYDFVRDIGHFDFMFMLGSKSTRIDFEKLITKDVGRKREKNKDFYKQVKPVEEFDETL